MKRTIAIINFVILTFVYACSPGTSLTPAPVPAAATEPGPASVPTVTIVAEQPTIQAEPTLGPTETAALRQPTAEPTRAKGGKVEGVAPPTSAIFVAAEVLGRPTDKSVTVNVVPSQELEIYYEYGSAAGTYTGQTAVQTATAGTPLETVIGELQPDSRYYYRIRYRQPGAGDFTAGEEHSFVTQRSPGRTFTFGVQGDSHPERTKKMFDPDLYRRTLLNVAADQPDFYMALGDDFSVDTLKTVNADTVTQRYIGQRQFLGLVGGSAPIFLVNGNHEQAALANLDGTPNNVAVWAQNARNSYYSQPAPDGFYTGDTQPVEFIGQLRDYYAWTWGDALFVVIDPYWHSAVAVDNELGGGKKNRDMWGITLGDEQYQWLKQTLEQSQAKYKFVFAHHVHGTGRGGIELANLYEWGGHDRNGAYQFAQERPGWEKPVHQLMADNGVTIFFQGHDHIFCRQELDGVVYQTLPVPADPNYALINAEAYRSGEKLPGSGYLRVTVAPQGVTVEYVRSFREQDEADGQANGQVAYSYTIGQPVSSVLPAPTTLPAAASASNRQGASPAQNVALGVPAHAVDIILGRPTDHSITASVLAYEDGEGFIAYGRQPGSRPDRTPSFQLSQGQPVEVRLEPLQPDTQYAYQLFSRRQSSGEFTAGEEGTFHTQRGPDSTFTFTVQADSHLDSNSSLDVYARTLANVLVDRPDFHLDLGDTFMTDKYQPYTGAQQQYLAQRYYLGLVGRSAPLFLALGNHDGESGGRRSGGADNMGAWSAQQRTRYFPNPLPDDFYTGNLAPDESIGLLQDYYAWNWGNALFVVLDPYRYTVRQGGGTDNWSRTLGREQYEWLKNALETSQANFKFVFIHQLVGGLDNNGRGGAGAAKFFEWGGQNLDGSWGFAEHRPGWDKPIHQLLVENHVTAVFHGHDHLFVKEELDGVIYQLVPQPSTERYDATRSAREYGYVDGDVLGSPGHVRVTVSPSQVVVEYVRAYLPEDENSERLNGNAEYVYTIAGAQPAVTP